MLDSLQTIGYYSSILTLVFLSLRVILQIIRIKSVPPNIPWAGAYNNSLLAKFIACLSEPFIGRSRIEEGYEKFGKHNLPFVLPALHWPTVVLPPSDASWVGQQVEEVLGHVKPFDDVISFDLLAHGPNTDSVHDFTVIRRNLTRQMRTLVPQALDEIEKAFGEELKALDGDGDGDEGLDGDGWKEVKISEVIQNVSFRAANRIFVGLPLCRDARFSRALEWWLLALASTGLVLRYGVPFPLRRWCAWALSPIPNLLQYRVLRFVLPAVKERLERRRGGEAGKGEGREEPNDMIQWIIDTNAEKGDPAELYPRNVAGKLILFNFFAVNTTSLVATSTIVDVLGHDSHRDLVAQLQKEAEEIMPEVPSDSKVLFDMQKMDSVIRETLRFDPFLAQGMLREVMLPQGLETPSGLHLPRGCHVVSIVSSMQRDDSKLQGASEYDPLRYYKEGLETGKQQPAVKLDETYLSFGLGRFACPGRFFALHSLKLILGHLLSNYDLEPSSNNKDIHLEIGDAKIISPKVLVRCRKRRTFKVSDPTA